MRHANEAPAQLRGSRFKSDARAIADLTTDLLMN
jgi:hypothetical protein